VQIVLVDLLRSTNVQLDAVVGHSSGEIGAAYAAGYISASDAIRIAYYRGLHSVLASGNDGKLGAMMAVGTSAEDAIEVCDLPEFKDRISVAAYNSSESVTLSGDADSIQEAQMIFEEENKFARILKVNKAYHSHHMVPCSAKYIKSIQACDIQLQTPPHNASAWLSSVSEDPISTSLDELRDVYWNNNMLKPVLFSQAVEMAVAERGPFDLAIEIGPHPALKGPVIQTIKDLIGGESIPYCGLLSRGKNNIECFADALGFIWKMTNSTVVDFQSYDRLLVDGPNPSLLKNLPTYAWDYERTFWHESRLSKAFANKSGSVHDLLGTRSPDGTKEEFRWRNLVRLREIPWVNGHQCFRQ
jgi:hybrid polyketide synthase/nonribosomal peptide synthetase ACE1